jgi:hypothetical protein
MLGSLQEGTASLGQTITQMLPMLFGWLIYAPISASVGW